MQLVNNRRQSREWPAATVLLVVLPLHPVVFSGGQTFFLTQKSMMLRGEYPPREMDLTRLIPREKGLTALPKREKVM